MERNGLSNFCRQSPKEHSCEIISKTDLAEEVVKSIFLFIALAAILFSVAESTRWLRRRNRFKGFSIFSSGGHLVQWSGTV